jgi:hypothetical protein
MRRRVPSASHHAAGLAAGLLEVLMTARYRNALRALSLPVFTVIDIPPAAGAAALGVVPRTSTIVAETQSRVHTPVDAEMHVVVAALVQPACFAGAVAGSPPPRALFRFVVFLLLVFTGAVKAAPANLPATGQTTCYDTAGSIVGCGGTGQDGDSQAGVGWSSARYVDNGDGTITDTLTGLMWLKDLNCASSAGYDPDGTGDGSMTWSHGLQFVADLNSGSVDISSCASYTAGHTDWRLPNYNELESLSDYETFGMYGLGSYGFQNVPAYGEWWSSTSLTAQAAYVGNGYGGGKSNKSWIAPVRGATAGNARVPRTGQTVSYESGDDGDLQMGVAWPDPRFIDNGDGTVTDALTGLIWLKDANCAGTIGHDPSATGDGSTVWQAALDFVAGINSGSHDISACAAYTGSYTDWRLPNLREIRSLYDYSQGDPALPTGHPFANVQTSVTNQRKYWSSTTYALLKNIALQADMLTAWITSYGKTTPHWIWPVRGTVATEDDFNGDGYADILWRKATGASWVYFMEGSPAPASEAAGPTVAADWLPVGLGDFNGDGITDVFWRKANGATWFHLMNGSAIAAEGPGVQVAPAWIVETVADFDGDGRDDILWRRSNGATWFYLMDGMNVTSEGPGNSVSLDWALAASGDFDGDGKEDLLWRKANGATWFYLMDGMSIMSQGPGNWVNPAWEVSAVADFNGDGKTDIWWRKPATGATWFYFMDGMSVSSQSGGATVPTAWVPVAVRDFSGDGKADVMWRKTNGATWFHFMDGAVVGSEGAGNFVSPVWQVVDP